MILDKPIDPNYIATLSEEEKIKLAQQAYAEFAQIVNQIGDEQRKSLGKILSEVENEKIAEVRQAIQQHVSKNSY